MNSCHLGVISSLLSALAASTADATAGRHMHTLKRLLMRYNILLMWNRLTVAVIAAPKGLSNLGNTCYLNA